MKFAAAPGVVLVATGTPVEYYGLPPWLYLAISILGSGVAGKVVWDRQQRKLEQRLTQLSGDKTRAERDLIYQQIAERTGEQFRSLEARYDQARAELEAERQGRELLRAERDATVMRLEHRIKLLEDELATTRAQVGLSERRSPRT